MRRFRGGARGGVQRYVPLPLCLCGCVLGDSHSTAAVWRPNNPLPPGVENLSTNQTNTNTQTHNNSSYEASFKQVECMRLTYEPLLYKYGADLVLNGHVHAYERSKPVYNYTLDACGAVHITGARGWGRGRERGAKEGEGTTVLFRGADAQSDTFTCTRSYEQRTSTQTHHLPSSPRPHLPPYPATTIKQNPPASAVGCGGKPGEPGSGVDALDSAYIEQGAFYCKDPAVLDKKPNPTQPLRCTTYQPELGGFCWDRQPPFSAYRESAFGAGVLTLLNATHAEVRGRPRTAVLCCVTGWGEGDLTFELITAPPSAPGCTHARSRKRLTTHRALFAHPTHNAKRRGDAVGVGRQRRPTGRRGLCNPQPRRAGRLPAAARRAPRGRAVIIYMTAGSATVRGGGGVSFAPLSPAKKQF